jgi:hypothetical protein
MFLLLLACIFFWKVILFPDRLIYVVYHYMGVTGISDIYNSMYPWSFFTDSLLEKGNLPLWLPYSLSGEPFIANPQTAVFYPLNIILFSIFSANLAFGYGVLLHVFLAGFFMYLLVRYIGLDKVSSLISAIVFMFGSFLINRLGVYSMITTIAWLPLIFLLFSIALDKKSYFWGLTTAIFLSLQFLAGQTQFFLYTVFALGIYLLFRSFFVLKETNWNFRDRKYLNYFIIFVLVLTVCVLLSAIQLFPALELSKYTTRGDWSYDDTTYASLPPQHIITFLLPWFFGNPIGGNYWGEGGYGEIALYLGIFPLILVLFAVAFKRNNRYVLFFSVLALLSLLFAMGKFTPFYWLLWKFIPGFGQFRCPGRLLFLFAFSTSILSGFGFSFLTGNITSKEKEKIWKAIKILGVLILLLTGIIIVAHVGGEHIIQFGEKMVTQEYYKRAPTLPLEHYLQRVNLMYSTIVEDMLILLALSIVTGTVIALRIKEKMPLKYFNIIVILFILSNLWFYNNGFIDSKDTKKVFLEPESVTFIKKDPGINQGIYRIYNYNFRGSGLTEEEDIFREIPGSFNIIYGIHDANGDFAYQLRHYYQLYISIRNVSENENRSILNLLNAKYILTKEQLSNSGFKLVFAKNDSYVYENEQVLPKSFIVHKAKVVPSEKDTLKELTDENFDPKKYVLLDKSPGNEIFDDGGSERVEIIKYSPNEIIIKANISNPGFLVLSEVWYPTWKVYIDGKPSKIYKSYLALMSVYVDKGEHEVRFTHESFSLKVGSWITFSTIILLIMVTTAGIWRKRRVSKK